jgi:hypothetical protein
LLRNFISASNIVFLKDLFLGVYLLSCAIGAREVQRRADGVSEKDMILSEMRVEAIFRPLVCSPLSSFFAIAGKLVLVTIVVRPPINGGVIERIDQQGLLFRQDRRPIVVALGQGLTMRVSFREDEITLASGCAGSESRKHRKLSKVHGGISMPIAPYNSVRLFY